MTIFQLVVSDSSMRAKAAAAVRSVSHELGLSEIMSAIEAGTPLREFHFYGIDHDEVSFKFVAILDALESKGIGYKLFQVTRLPELPEPIRQQVERRYIENVLVRHAEISAEEDSLIDLENDDGGE